MWMFLLMSAHGAAPIALEAGPHVALPHARLGLAPGLRLLGEIEATDGLWLGVEGEARLPGAGTTDLRGPNLVDPVDLRSSQTAWSAAGRIDWIPTGDAELRPRVGMALGAARLIQASRTDAGVSREAASSLWLKPELGALLTVGPGFLTAGAYWAIAPTRMETLGGAGNAVGLGVSWRQPLN